MPTQFLPNSSKKTNTFERIVMKFLLWVFCMTNLVEKNPIPPRLWHQALGHVGATDVACSLGMYVACARSRLMALVTLHWFILPWMCVSKAAKEGDHKCGASCLVCICIHCAAYHLCRLTGDWPLWPSCSPRLWRRCRMTWCDALFWVAVISPTSLEAIV